MAATTGYVYDPRFLDHDTGAGHPERPARLTRTAEALESNPWFAGLSRFLPAPASRAALEAIHSAAYVDHAEQTIASGADHLDSMDVAVGTSSFEVACLAAGAGMTLADAVMAGQIDNGMAIARPPGHHAEADRALGFCIFNNVAILAEHLKSAHGIGRIAIVDFDVHHGNGTQSAFEADPNVMYVSTHQFPYYPGTGAAEEIGAGRGAGTIVNCPLRAGSGNREYEAVFMKRILPALDAFGPDFVLVSAGFDAHADDPLGDMRLTTDFYGRMTEWLLEIADRHAGGRLISLLEGGYDIDALAASVVAHIGTLAGIPEAQHTATAASAG